MPRFRATKHAVTNSSLKCFMIRDPLHKKVYIYCISREKQNFWHTRKKGVRAKGGKRNWIVCFVPLHNETPSEQTSKDRFFFPIFYPNPLHYIDGLYKMKSLAFLSQTPLQIFSRKDGDGNKQLITFFFSGGFSFLFFLWNAAAPSFFSWDVSSLNAFEWMISFALALHKNCRVSYSRGLTTIFSRNSRTSNWFLNSFENNWKFVPHIKGIAE